jgi:ketosteroid isomerase-like protein
VDGNRNVDLIRRYFDAVHRDPAETSALYAPGAVLHYSGRHVLSGDHRGVEAIQHLFRQSREVFQGTQRLEVHDVVAGGGHAVALLEASAERDGRRAEWRRVVVFHVSAGLIQEQWIIDSEQHVVEAVLAGR